MLRILMNTLNNRLSNYSIRTTLNITTTKTKNIPKYQVRYNYTLIPHKRTQVTVVVGWTIL